MDMIKHVKGLARWCIVSSPVLASGSSNQRPLGPRTPLHGLYCSGAIAPLHLARLLLHIMPLLLLLHLTYRCESHHLKWTLTHHQSCTMRDGGG